MNHKFLQVIGAVVLVFLLLALGDSLPFWMPDMNEMIVLLLVTVLVLGWAAFIMYERAVDEREIQLRMNAGRVAYLSGIIVLTVGLVWQGVHHAIDPWILGALGVMVLAKLGARLFEDRE